METRLRIANKAWELYLAYGIRSVSMDDIANQLGISKKTIYQYFQDKDELVMEVVNAHISHIQQQCISCREDAKDAVEEIFNTMERILDQFRTMNPMILFDMEKFHHRAYEHFLEYKSKFLGKIIRENIEWGKEEGLYRADINVDVMAKFRLESMLIPFNIQAFPPGSYNLADVTEEIIRHFVYGLCSVKGYKLIEKYSKERQKKLV